MKTKTILQRFLGMIFILLITACNLRAYYAPTLTAPHPTNTVTLQSTATKTPLPANAPLQSFTLDGLRMAYIMDGNLYIQNSGGQPIQLTHSGQDYNPTFSDDGQKIVFFRGGDDQKDALYSINADGNQEIALVTSNSLIALGLGYDEQSQLLFMDFVPNTHQIIFNTREFVPGEDTDAYPKTILNFDVLLANVNTAEIKKLVNPQREKCGGCPGENFHVSPDGKLVAVKGENHIDIIGINGDTLFPHIVTYQPEWLHEHIALYWGPDSTEFMIMPPLNGDADNRGPAEPAVIQKYSLKGNPMSEIRFQPAPEMYFDSAVLSPDRNWLVYQLINNQTENPGEGVYLGNLKDGSVHKVESWSSEYYYSFVWSNDNKYFVGYFEDYPAASYLGNLQGDVKQLPFKRFLGWTDHNHYIFYTENGDIIMSEIGQETGVLVVDLPKHLMEQQFSYLIYVYLQNK